MTEILVVNDWFANRLIQKTIQTFTAENIEFEIMALNQSMIDKVKSCDTHKEMLFFAADNGLVFNGTRAIASKDLTVDDIDALWGDESVDIDCDPCVRARVGEKVCEISGLTEYIQEMIVLEAEVAAEEEAARLKIDAIDGDKLNELPDDLVIDGMNDADNLSQESLDEPDTVIYAN